MIQLNSGPDTHRMELFLQLVQCLPLSRSERLVPACRLERSNRAANADLCLCDRNRSFQTTVRRRYQERYTLSELTRASQRFDTGQAINCSCTEFSWCSRLEIHVHGNDVEVTLA